METTTAKPSTAQVIANIVVFIFLALFAILAYTFVHEGGHALAGILMGGTLTAFSVDFWGMTAHAGLIGEFTTCQRASLSLAGIGMPLVLWAIGLGLAPRRVPVPYDVFRAVLSIGIVNTLLAWVVLPILFMTGNQIGDDATSFLTTTGVHPLAEAGVAFVLWVGGWVYFLVRTDMRATIARFRTPNVLIGPDSRRALRVLVPICCLLIAASVLAGVVSDHNELQAPAGYMPAITLDLSQRGYADEAVHTLSLEAPLTLGVHVQMRDLATGPVDLVLTGPDGFHSTIFRNESPTLGIGRATARTVLDITASGTYAIRVTAPQQDGSLAFAVRTTAPGQ